MREPLTGSDADCTVMVLSRLEKEEESVRKVHWGVGSLGDCLSEALCRGALERGARRRPLTPIFKFPNVQLPISIEPSYPSGLSTF